MSMGDRQHRADRLDPVNGAVGIDELHHHFARRSELLSGRMRRCLARGFHSRASAREPRAFFQPVAFVRRQARPLAYLTLRLLDVSNHSNLSKLAPHRASWLVGVYGFL
jgi:hypothetical protein